MTLEIVRVAPRIYINSFPKSGTHLAYLITAPLAKRQKPQYWLGSFSHNSWTLDWMDDTYVLGVIRGQPMGTWMMGHMGYQPQYEAAFQEMGTAMLFVYRDPRDVAVSLTYHIESDNENLKHPGRAEFMALPSHQARLAAVIAGHGNYPGVLTRWSAYAPWLDCDWVHPIRYEDMRERPRETAREAIDYVINRTVGDAGGIPIMLADHYAKVFEKSVELMDSTEHSASFRTGRVGDWRTEFTDGLAELFQATDTDNWIERLGYERA